MILDANLLLFAVDSDSPFHAEARTWLTRALGGPSRVGLPWQSLAAFVRISTNPRAFRHALSPPQAVDLVEAWLAADRVWTPGPTDRHGIVLGQLVRKYHVTGKLVPDAQLAALAIEHGLVVCSADTDFARFTEVRWVNPLSEA